MNLFSKEMLLNELKGARQEFFEAVESLRKKGKEKETILGNWTLKEALSHIAGWDEESLNATGRILEFNKPESLDWEVDDWNAKEVARRKDMAIDEILQEMRKNHNKFLEILSNLEEEQFKSPVAAKLRGKDVNILFIVNEVIEHDKEHTRELFSK
jgi:uncharacterized damage-inducible protein DinB